MVSQSTARLIARDWNGGMGTAMHSFWRTGRADFIMLELEARDVLKFANPRHQSRIKQLIDFARSN